MSVITGGVAGGGVMDILGWTLLHSVWQGALVASLLWCGLALMRGASARARYGVCCLALIVTVALPLGTFARLGGFGGSGVGRSGLARWVVIVDAVGGTAAHEPLAQRVGEALAVSVPVLPWVWLAGVLLYANRLGLGLIAARRLRTARVSEVEARIAAVFAEVAGRVGVRRVVGLLESMQVEAPTVVGWLKPVVLLPACCFAGMPVEQMEALLAHELAHIRRHDYLLSVLQSAVEALLFYHPAVWWISRQVRRERECCCDEIAAEVAGDRLVYARALSLLEEQRLVGPAVGLGANGGVLHMRIRRVLGYREGSVASQMGAVAVLCVVALGATALLVRKGQAQASAAGEPAAVRILVAERRAESVPERVSLAGQSGAPMMEAKVSGGSSSAGQTGLGVLDGVIVDPTGAVMPRATVSISNAQTGERPIQRTDETGRYAFSVPAGRYTLDAAATGFQMAVAHNLQVSPADPLHLTIKLNLGAASEFVKVSGSGALGGSSAAQDPAGPMRISAGLMADNVVSRVPPVYPPDAKAQGIQGTVVLKALISGSGDVEGLVVVSGPAELQASAMDAVKQWRYKPYLLNGEPVEVETTVNVNYTLAGSQGGSSNSADEQRYADAVPKKIGNGVSPPDLIYSVVPSMAGSDEGGTVVVHLWVTPEGTPVHVRVERSAGSALDEKAVESVRQYRFKPAMEDGKPVLVELNVEVNFKHF